MVFFHTTRMEQSSYVFSRNVRSDAEMARHACFTFGAFGMSSGPSTSLGFILAALPGRSDALTSQAGNSSRALKNPCPLVQCRPVERSVQQFQPSFCSARRGRPRALTIYGCREEASDKSVAGRPELMDRQFVTSRPAAHMRASPSAPVTAPPDGRPADSNLTRRRAIASIAFMEAFCSVLSFPLPIRCITVHAERLLVTY